MNNVSNLGNNHLNESLDDLSDLENEMIVLPRKRTSIVINISNPSLKKRNTMEERVIPFSTKVFQTSLKNPLSHYPPLIFQKKGAEIERKPNERTFKVPLAPPQEEKNETPSINVLTIEALNILRIQLGGEQSNFALERFKNDF